MMSSGTVGGMPSLAFLTNNRSKQCRDALPLLLVLLLLVVVVVVVAELNKQTVIENYFSCQI